MLQCIQPKAVQHLSPLLEELRVEKAIPSWSIRNPTWPGLVCMLSPDAAKDVGTALRDWQSRQTGKGENVATTKGQLQAEHEGWETAALNRAKQMLNTCSEAFASPLELDSKLKTALLAVHYSNQSLEKMEGNEDWQKLANYVKLAFPNHKLVSLAEQNYILSCMAQQPPVPPMPAEDDFFGRVQWVQKILKDLNAKAMATKNPTVIACVQTFVTYCNVDAAKLTTAVIRALHELIDFPEMLQQLLTQKDCHCLHYHGPKDDRLRALFLLLPIQANNCLFTTAENVPVEPSAKVESGTKKKKKKKKRERRRNFYRVYKANTATSIPPSSFLEFQLSFLEFQLRMLRRLHPDWQRMRQAEKMFETFARNPSSFRIQQQDTLPAVAAALVKLYKFPAQAKQIIDMPLILCAMGTLSRKYRVAAHPLDKREAAATAALNELIPDSLQNEAKRKALSECLLLMARVSTLDDDQMANICKSVKKCGGEDWEDLFR